MAARRIFEEISLKFVKQIQFQFCPWEKYANETRTMLTVVGASKVRETNPNCKFKTTVRHDGSPPQVLVQFDDGKKLLFKSEHLTSNEMISKLVEICKTKEAVALNQ